MGLLAVLVAQGGDGGGAFGGLDLFLGIVVDGHGRGAPGDVLAQRDQFPAQREFADHPRIVPCRIGRHRRPGQPRQIGRPAQFLEPGVMFHERLDRHWRGKRVAGDPFRAQIEDAAMHGVIEMFAPDQPGHRIEHVVVGQQRAQKLLFGLDLDERVLGQAGDLDGGARRRRAGEVLGIDRVHGGEVVHVLEEDRGLHDAGEARAAGLEHGGEVCQRGPRLRLDALRGIDDVESRLF